MLIKSILVLFLLGGFTINQIWAQHIEVEIREDLTSGNKDTLSIIFFNKNDKKHKELNNESLGYTLFKYANDTLNEDVTFYIDDGSMLNYHQYKYNNSGFLSMIESCNKKGKKLHDRKYGYDLLSRVISESLVYSSGKFLMKRTYYQDSLIDYTEVLINDVEKQMKTNYQYDDYGNLVKEEKVTFVNDGSKRKEIRHLIYDSNGRLVSERRENDTYGLLYYWEYNYSKDGGKNISKFDVTDGKMGKIEFIITYTSIDSIDESYSKLVDALDDFENIHESYVDLGDFYQAVGRYEEAIESYDCAIEKKGEYTEPLNNRGFTRMLKGDYLGAIKDFSRTLEINNKHIMAHNNIGICFQKLDNTAKACEHWKKAIEYGYKYDSSWKEKYGIDDPNELIMKHCK